MRVSRGTYTRDHGDPSKERATLEGLAIVWRTPMASDAKRGSTSKRGSSSPYRDRPGGHSLVTEAAAWSTPAARDWRSDSGQMTDQELYGVKGAPLSRVACFRFDPSLFQAPPICAGSMSSTAGLSSNQPLVKRRLNPIFVEALMRWPTGWTDFGSSATASTLWQQHMRGYVSMLVSAMLGQSATMPC